MTELIDRIFRTSGLEASVDAYFKVVSRLDTGGGKALGADYQSAIQALDQARPIANPAIYQGMLTEAVTRFNLAVSSEKKDRLLLTYLGLMLCYHYLGEVNAIRHIQRLVERMEYKVSFWEENGGAITEGAMVLLGVAMAAMGGGNAAMGAGMGGRTGRQMHEDARSDLKKHIQDFNDLKAAILALNFV